MLMKISSKNQIVIPKAVLQRAGLGENHVYFDVEYEEGRIVLKPMRVEEQIAPEALARFEAKELKRERGDRAYASMDSLIRDLHRRHPKKR